MGGLHRCHGCLGGCSRVFCASRPQTVILVWAEMHAWYHALGERGAPPSEPALSNQERALHKKWEECGDRLSNGAE